MIRGFFAALLAAASLAGAQQTKAVEAPAAPGPNAQVLFSRSADSANDQSGGSSAAQAGKSAAATPAEIQPAPPTEQERQKITFLSYNLDVHLRPKQHAIAVRARMLLRNDGEQPVRDLPLQLSSSLSWVSIQAAGRPLAFRERLVDSDADHTGMLKEAEVKLPQALQAKQTLALDVQYQGTVTLTGQRLQQIGAPTDAAARSDWDRIDSNFVGLRGFGNVVWYPVVTAPVLLGDGDRFFSEIGRQKLRQSEAIVSMHVTEEFFGPAPNVAVLDGEPIPVVIAAQPQSAPASEAVPGIATSALPQTRLGFAMPSLFLATRTQSTVSGLHLDARPEDAADDQAYAAAARMVAPLLGKWLGSRPGAALTIVDLPEANDTPYEQGSVLFLGLRQMQPAELALPLIHALARAGFRSPYPWLEEGAAYFMVTLWVEQNHGREAALREMDDQRGALTLAEPGEPGANHPSQEAAHQAAADPPANSAHSAGEPLLAATDPIYYRVKAAYVFWMLRSMVGDDALAQAFRAYNPAKDQDGREFERALERTSGRDLSWFFSDWVYHDRGLPDLSIAGIYPNASSIPGSYIVAVKVSNSGGAAADVPVSVRSDSGTVSARLRVPANSSVTHRFLLSGRPVEAAVNDGTVPEVEASIHRMTISGQP